MKQWSLGLGWLLLFCSVAQAERWQATVAEQTALHHDAVVELRHWFHQYPELSNREFNTAKRVAKELRDLGFDEVSEGVAHTGVVGILKGGKPGPVVALRADMDALPVKEKTGLPFCLQGNRSVGGKTNRRNARVRP